MAEFSGHLALRAARRDDGRSVLAAQSFRAPYHISKPYWDFDAQTLLVQVVNPTAGILSGDQLTSEIVVDSGAALLVTTPSASRLFQMREGSARCQQTFTVARTGWLEVLPEPLVPHRGSHYEQRTNISVEPGGEMFYADLLMPGRVAHGESWVWNRLNLQIEVRSAGELLLRERFDQSGAALKQLAVWAGSGEAACFGNAVLIAGEDPRDGEWRAAINALQSNGLWIGVSALRKGGWSLKFVAADGTRLRGALQAIREILAVRFPRLGCNPRKL